MSYTVTFRGYILRLWVFLGLDELCSKEDSQCLLILVTAQKSFHRDLVNKSIASNLVYHCPVRTVSGAILPLRSWGYRNGNWIGNEPRCHRLTWDRRLLRNGLPDYVHFSPTIIPIDWTTAMASMMTTRLLGGSAEWGCTIGVCGCCWSRRPSRMFISLLFAMQYRNQRRRVLLDTRLTQTCWWSPLRRDQALREWRLRKVQRELCHPFRLPRH